MDTILFIETSRSGSSREAIRAASRLGYQTVLLTKRMNSVKQGEEFSEVTQLIHLKEITEQSIRLEVEKLKEQGKTIKGILSFVDPFVSLAAKLMNEICETDISVDALTVMEDKAETRSRLKNHGATPKFEIFDPRDDLQLVLNKERHFPVMVKLAVSKASKEVYKVENVLEMEQTIRKLLEYYSMQKIVIEEFIKGPQFLVEVLVQNRNIHIIAIFKQEITKNKKFIVTGYEIQLHLDSLMHKKLVYAIETILNELGVTNAVSHFEVRYVNGTWKLIEMNPRISGAAMNRMIEEAYGYNYAEKIIQMYLGHTPNLEKRFERHIYTKYLTINSYGYLLILKGENEALNQPGVKEVYIKPRIGTLLRPAISMGDRYGYVIASGDTVAEAKSNAITAAKMIKFYLDPI
ncbi:ATP-grasp domain-containing protein [Sporosarcina sp. CAU 1771]